MFNTLGNLTLWPRAGLLFVDWQTGTLLHLMVTAEVLADGPGVDPHARVRRLVRMNVLGGWLRPAALPLIWSAPEPPPQFALPLR